MYRHSATSLLKVKGRGEDFEYMSLMESYFDRTQNPSNSDMLAYEDIVVFESTQHYNSRKRLYHSIGLDLDDLKNLSRVYLVSFLGLFSLDKNQQKLEQLNQIYKKKNSTSNEVPKEVVLKKNRSNFICFLRQKLKVLLTICRKKARNILCSDITYKYYRIKKEDILPENEAFSWDKTLQSLSKQAEEIIEYHFNTAKKLSKSSGKQTFNHNGFFYFKSLPEFFTPTSFDTNFIEANDSIENSYCCSTALSHTENDPQCIIEKRYEGGDCYDRFEELEDFEKRDVLLAYIKKNNDKELIEAAYKLLQEMGYDRND